VLRSAAHPLYHQLVAGRALPAIIVSALAGVTTLALVYRRHYEAARYTAALAVAAVIAGWALGQWPRILPGLTVRQAAASHDTLVAVVVAVLARRSTPVPARTLLFRLTLGGALHIGPAAPHEVPGDRRGLATDGLLPRIALASLIVGIDLLNVADARWAHAVGVVSLFTFIVTAYLAIVPAALTGKDTP
jgi:cytochrome bd ubiquinol oxidase subunit II